LDGAGLGPAESFAGGRGDPPKVPEKIDLVVRGGIVVTAEGRQRVDVGVAGGRVVQLGGSMTGTREIDADGRFVLPGGVDPHVHLNVEKVDDDPDWVDDYTSGSQAALAGGVTAVGNMSYVLPPHETIAARVRAETALVAKQAIADVFFHAVVLSPSAEIVAEIPAAVEGGQSSTKLFMCLPSFEAQAADYARVMKATGDAGGLTLIHCEDLATIACCTSMLASQSRTAIAHFPDSRPVASEVIAVERAIAMCRATGAPTYIVHLSSAGALRAAAAARAEGLPLYVETRPLYLYLTEERYGDDDGAIYVAQPPLRAEADRDALWRGIIDGTVDTLGSDHAPWTRALKLEARDIANPRPGVAELDTMLPLFFTEAVGKERISLERFVALTSTNAARLCGLYPRKGTIAIGSDADLVVWETRGDRRVIRDEALFSRAGHSVYAGRELSAWPRTTIRRGEVVFDDGRVVGRPGSGQVIPRGKLQRLR
jgi:dihydropyrimidinase